MSQEVIYLTYDNASYLVLLEGSNPVSLSSVTRVVIVISGVQYDSDILGSTKIWWTDQVTYDGASVDALKFKLGLADGLVKGSHEGCRLILYDVSNPNGVVWTDKLIVNVKSA